MNFAVGLLRRGQAALGSDPGQVRLTELGQNRRGGLVAERQQLIGADRVVAVCCPGRRHGVLEQPRGLSRDIPEPGVLVGLEDGVHLPGELIQRGWFAVTLATGQQGRQLAVIHEDRAERGHGLGPAIGGPVQQGRLADQVADGHVEHLGEGADDRQPVKLDPVVLGPLQPVGRAADQACENFLGHSPAPPVPGHPLANGQVLRHPAHGLTLPAAYAVPRKNFPGFRAGPA